MDATEFNDLLKRLGDKYLAPLGFEYKHNHWYYITDEYQVALMLAKEKNTPTFKVKYLTISFIHFHIQRADYTKHLPYFNYPSSGAMQISPMYLSDALKGQWHYVNPLKCIKDRQVFLPVYYGGKPSFSLKGLFNKPEKTTVQLPQDVALYGADYISEKECISMVETAIKNTAEHAQTWAKTLTPEYILEQLTTYNEDWLTEKGWIDAYQTHLHEFSSPQQQIRHNMSRCVKNKKSTSLPNDKPDDTTKNVKTLGSY